ncbi:response regulator [Cytophagaceae bacterium DM2B3-1]|uniref:Response regulator n=1 Tax=Xanthocytophaga flava TaxID=3048013 RepID=A0ABT7CFT9_9BACT|nr:response regulator [Xanthocytophaga flavus]MDJ1473528.1 response regulator [Xanthocytophaga flavus]MDJ1491932.1 response regulator [Xanthocytophaga flavus]
MNSVSTSSQETTFSKNGILFYLVDDDDLFHLIHNRFIKSQLPDAEIVNFIDPRDALTTILENTQQPGIVLLDLNMPYMTGWEWLSAFAKQTDLSTLALNIFILSSSDSNQDRARVKDYPFVKGYLVKPLTQADISKIIS